MYEKSKTDTSYTAEENNPKNLREKKTIFRAYQIIWYVLSVIEILLGFRLILKGLGANPYNGFTYFIYSITNPFAYPFQGIITTNTYGIYIIEWSTMIGMLVYFFLAYGIAALFQFIKPVSKEEVEENVD
ncbi:MAG TPA: YggT family protein [Patescibacteria group bacterium]